MNDIILLSIYKMAATFMSFNYDSPTHIVVSDKDHASMRLLGVDLDGKNGGPKIIPASKAANILNVSTK